MNKLLLKKELTWKKLIIFSILIGIYTGIMAMIPITENTSFRDISISFEWWILFGIIVILNSKSNFDSALKCFVFFLISQPIVYLVQVPFQNLGFGIFMYYERWFKWTLLTLPMGYIGYYMKKNDLLGILILSPMLLFLGFHSYTFFKEVINYFPNHLLSFIFCFVTMYLYVTNIIKEKKIKNIGYGISILILLIVITLNILPNLNKNVNYTTTIKCNSEELVFDDTFNTYLDDDSYGKVEIQKEQDSENTYCIYATFSKTGTTKLYIEKEDVKHIFDLKIERNTYSINKIED